MMTEPPSRIFTLYGTEACHLCELAESMVDGECRARADVAFEKVDIAGSDPLFARYGVRIPVLRHPDGRELGWPFTADQLGEFLAP